MVFICLHGVVQISNRIFVLTPIQLNPKEFYLVYWRCRRRRSCVFFTWFIGGVGAGGAVSFLPGLLEV